MTRVNCVPVETLCDQHLLAEYRELPRIFRLVSKAIERGESPDDPKNPETYRLGRGHCRFFYGKLGYLSRRWGEVYNELDRRLFNLSFKHDIKDTWGPVIPGPWWGDWEPTPEAVMLCTNRVMVRMPEHPRWGGFTRLT